MFTFTIKHDLGLEATLLIFCHKNDMNQAVLYLDQYNIVMNVWMHLYDWKIIFNFLRINIYIESSIQILNITILISIIRSYIYICAYSTVKSLIPSTTTRFVIILSHDCSNRQSTQHTHRLYYCLQSTCANFASVIIDLLAFCSVENSRKYLIYMFFYRKLAFIILKSNRLPIL